MLEQLVICWLLFLILHSVTNGRFFLWELVSIVPSFVFLLLPSLFLVTALIEAAPAPILFMIGLCFLLGLPHLDLILFPISQAKRSKHIKLFNWNTEFWDSKWKDQSDFLNYIRSFEADVYHLQETIFSDHGVKEYIDVTKLLIESFPDYTVIQTGEVVTMTRLKVISHNVIDRYILRVDVAVNDQVLSLYNLKIRVHLLPRLVSEPVTFFRDLKRRFYQRKKEYAALEQSLMHNPNSIVMSGDFNTSKVQRPIKRLLRKFKDAYAATNSGFPTTYTFLNFFKFWRIDYVLGRKVNFHSYANYDSGVVSDHDALIVEFSV